MRFNPLPNFSQSDLIRFWSFVYKDQKCWVWTGCIGQTGYGKFRIQGKTYPAHRLSYYLIYNDPGILLVRHICHRKYCVNPSHLILGTHSDNFKDDFEIGTRSNAGSQHPNSLLDESSVLEIKALLANGTSQGQIAKRFNINQGVISKIANGLAWTHV